MQLFVDTFSAGQVIEAARVSNSTLQTWFARGLIVAPQESPIAGGGAPGRYRRFTFRNVMEIAVAKALIDIGFADLSRAFSAARHFAHVGHVRQTLNDKPNRVPGLPFDDGGTASPTFLLVSGDRSAEFFWQKALGKSAYAYMKHELFGEMTVHDGFVTLDLSAVFERVATALGYNPRAILAEAYRWEAARQ
jgi:hypothetical protein